MMPPSATSSSPLACPASTSRPSPGTVVVSVEPLLGEQSALERDVVRRVEDVVKGQPESQPHENRPPFPCP